jgi:hypothetical protein
VASVGGVFYSKTSGNKLQASGAGGVRVYLSHPLVLLPSKTTCFHSFTMKATFSNAIVVLLAIFMWTAFAIGELQIFPVPIYSAVDSDYVTIRGGNVI